MRIEFDANEILYLKIALSRYLKGFENRKTTYEYKALYQILKVFERAYKRLEKKAEKG